MEMPPLMVSCCRDNGTSHLTDMGLTGVALIIPTILTKHMYMYRDHLIQLSPLLQPPLGQPDK